MTTYSPPPTPVPLAKLPRQRKTHQRPTRVLALTSWDLARDPALSRYLSRRLASGEALVALHGPPPISPVLIELGMHTESGLESGLVRALKAKGVPFLEVTPSDRKAQREAARASCVSVFGATRLLEAARPKRLGASLEEALVELAPRAVVEVVIEQERLFASPGLEALSLNRTELAALTRGSRDPVPRLALRALDAGASLVRVGSPLSLSEGRATIITQ